MALWDWYDLSTFFIYWVDIEAATRPQNYVYHTSREKRGRERYAFVYVTRGCLRYSFAENSQPPIVVGANEMIHLPKGSVYRYTALADTDLKVVQYRVADGEIPSYLQTPGKISLPNAEKLIDNFFEPHHRRTVNHPFYYMSCLFRLLWKIDEYQNKIPAKYQRIRPALLELNNNPADNRPIEYYAELCGISAPSFFRLFKDYTDSTPIEYRNNLRLQLAQSKLRSGECTVSEVADMCGFSNLSYFTRLYKKQFGHTPKAE